MLKFYFFHIFFKKRTIIQNSFENFIYSSQFTRVFYFIQFILNRRLFGGEKKRRIQKIRVQLSYAQQKKKWSQHLKIPLSVNKCGFIVQGIEKIFFIKTQPTIKSEISNNLGSK